jgi:hypothetical protein
MLGTYHCSILIIISHGLECEMVQFLPEGLYSEVRNETCRVSDKRKRESKGGIAPSHINIWMKSSMMNTAWTKYMGLPKTTAVSMSQNRKYVEDLTESCFTMFVKL